MAERQTVMETLERAARAVGKIDRDGERGLTLVNTQEIEAMAMVLVLCGLAPIRPETAPEDTDLRPHFRWFADKASD